MIFCTGCGRYYKEGTDTCSACHANLKTSSHPSFGGKPVSIRAAAASKEPLRAAAPLSLASVAAVAVDESEPPATPAVSETDPVFDRDKFLLRQKALAIKEKYYVTDDAGQPLAFVERPALLAQQLIMLAAVAATFFGGQFVVGFILGLIGSSLGSGLAGVLELVGLLVVLGLSGFVFVLLVPKRHVTFYRDDSKTEKMLEIRQLNKIEFPFANFSILDTAGNVVGSLRKNVLFDYVRRRWQVRNANGLQLCMAKEDSIILSLLRRTGIPIFAFFRTNFVFLRGQDVIGEFNRKITLLDRYVLDLTADHNRTFDRRIALALGVMLDTGERR
jgi:uncharacterized protein YxjI